MTTSFPTSLDSFTNPISSNTLASPDHAVQHANINDAVAALEAKVGADSSAVTTSLDYKISNIKLVTVSSQSASYTLVLGDAAKMVEMNNASANNLTVPPNSSVAFPVGTVIDVLQIGAGQTTIVAGSGVTINYAIGLKLRAQWSAASLVKRATNTWVAIGDLSA
jgi:alpha-D-ribose 1-methylphosphonate 5-triphosphate synthase subunit PhnH